MGTDPGAMLDTKQISEGGNPQGFLWDWEWGWLSQRGVVPRDACGEEGLGKHSRCSGNQKGGGELKEEVEEEVMGLAGCWVLGWQREVLVHRESWFLGG